MGERVGDEGGTGLGCREGGWSVCVMRVMQMRGRGRGSRRLGQGGLRWEGAKEGNAVVQKMCGQPTAYVGEEAGGGGRTSMPRSCPPFLPHPRVVNGG